RRAMEGMHAFLQSRAGENMNGATVVEAFKPRTKDQYTTAMDITIYFRIRQNCAWRVLREIGPDPAAFHERFRQQAEGAMRKVMGELYTEDLYNSDRRQEVVAKTLAELNESLASSHLEAKDILIRWIVFDPNFEQKLLAKQLLEQQKLLARSQTQREMQKQKTEMIQRETEAMVLAIEKEKEREIAVKTAATEAAIAAIKADAAYEAKKLLAEAEKSKRQAIAEGEKLREVARAKGQKAINEALQGKGGQLFLSRQMVENLQIGRLEINTNQFNPFDLKQFLRLIGAEE
ncbi:MAG: SPFH domain-containing protein, partial [Planctomycetota bacterium]|nr:SPFH domain-containing protein [Planctomycetota bacterium]